MLIAFVAGATAALSAGATVPAGPTLRLGGTLVEPAIVERNFDRFRRARDPRTATPTSLEITVWLEGFVDEQVVIAGALERGYGERAEVRESVARMERHMLTQPIGPLYAALCGGSTEPDRLTAADLTRRLAMLDARRAEAQQATGFRWIESAAVSAWAGLSSEPWRDGEIPATAIATVRDVTVGSYRDPRSDWPTRAGEFARLFNRRQVRVVPDGLAAWRTVCEDLVREEYDWREAHVRGLAAAPAFVAARENFRRYQALDLYEREAAFPGIEISPEELVRAYAARSDQYARPSRIAGTIRVLRAAADAVAEDGAGEIARRDGTVSATEGPPEFPYLWLAVSGDRRLRRVGPIQAADRWLVWERGATLAESRQSFDEIAPLLREQLRRERMSFLRRELGRRWLREWGAADATGEFIRAWTARLAVPAALAAPTDSAPALSPTHTEANTTPQTQNKRIQ